MFADQPVAGHGFAERVAEGRGRVLQVSNSATVRSRIVWMQDVAPHLEVYTGYEGPALWP